MPFTNPSPQVSSNLDLHQQLDKMRRDWDERARENALHYVDNSRAVWTCEEFFAAGQECILEQILTDPGNIFQGRDPKTFRMIEIGCGAGRLTNALAGVFGEVHGVDVSGEMLAQARTMLAGHGNVYLYQNNGFDLAVLPRHSYDFAFTLVVFQHIPSYAVIENYVREVNRLLRPGALFKFQVQGNVDIDTQPDDTWYGVSFTRQQAEDMAARTGFELRYTFGEGDQYYWLWYFKRPWFDSLRCKAAYQARRIRRGLARRLRLLLGRG